MRRMTSLWVALAALAFAPALSADRLITVDGRILEVKKAREMPEGDYLLIFEHGEVRCPKDQVASVEIEGDMSDYVPKNEDERKKLEKGYVRYQGKWMSANAYRAELKRKAQEARSRVEELAAHSHFYDGWQKETKHFIIQTNTSPELLEYYCKLLEGYYDLMNKRVGIKPTPTLRRTKMKVNIYRSREEFHELTTASGGVAGYFSFIDQELNFYHDYADPTISDWVALHECTHLLTYLIEPQSWPQIWVNEGIADYFGSSHIRRGKRGKLELEPGKLQVERVLTVQEAIKEDEYVPLERLFRLTKPEFRSFEYAHAWSFIYFLNTEDPRYERKNKYVKGFKRFFKDFYTVEGVEYSMERFPNVQGTAKIIPPEEVRRLLLKSIKVKDVAALEEEWKAFIMSIEIDAPEALFKRGYNVIRRAEFDDFEQAEKDLTSAISQGYDSARAHWALGVVRSWTKPGVQGGLADLRKAVELEPLEPLFRSSLGHSLGGSAVMAGSISIMIKDSEDTLLGKPEDLDEAKMHLGLAVEMAPDNDRLREQFDEFLVAYENTKAAEAEGR